MRFLHVLPLALLASLALRSAEPSPWPAPTSEMKPWTRWWWPASAVDKDNLTRELASFAEAGLGGVEITPIYGAKGFEPRFIPFLSPKYMEMLAYTAAEGKRLGILVDMATGTGWPFGGAQVTAEDAELQVAVKDGELAIGPTKFKVKRSAPGGEGLVVNPYSTAALANYLKPFDAALAVLPKGALHGQFHDSFEYKANWSKELEAKFREMHGYDLRDHAAAFGGSGDPDTVARVKSDYRETLSSLHLDYVRAWVGWAHKNGQVARNQAHGAPVNLLDLYGLSDVPETEIFGSLEYPIPGFRSDPDELSYNKPQPLVARFAASAAHVTGKNLVASETFTWLRQHFHEAPSQMKPELDALFLTGVNHVVYHGSCYSPTDAAWPGWLFYASTQYNSRNALWRDLGEGLNTYITRCQSLLQSGQPDNDVLVYWPVFDLWHTSEGFDLRFGMHDAKWIVGTPAGKLAEELINQGSGFDFVSDEQIASLTVSQAHLRAPGGTYRALIVPKTVHMQPATLQRLLDLAEAGATIVFEESLPVDVPGLGQVEKRRAELTKQLGRIKLGDQPTDGLQTGALGRGHVACGPRESAIVRFRRSGETLAEQGLSFIRRRLPDGDVYFVVNLRAKPFAGAVDLACSGGSALLLDPRTGRSGTAATKALTTGLQVHLQLEPGESIFVRSVPEHATSTTWDYRQTSGPAVALKNTWDVTFVRGGPALPPAFSANELKSWTAQGGEAERFAGTARYETEFELPAGVTADDWRLDLNDVCETARVFINGQQVDLLWSLPFRTRIGAWIKPGKNTLAIEVTNLSANRIRDLDKRGVVWKNFYEINFVNPHYQPLDAAVWPLKASGLLGPVTLTPLRKVDPNMEN